MEEFLNSQQVATWLQMPMATLYKKNSDGSGPRRYKVGKRVLYRRKDVEAWLEKQLVLDATGLDAGDQ